MRRRARELVLVDFFAGGGGVTQAAKQAGYTVAAAINHDPDVVAFHASKHPEVKHYCQDLAQFPHRQLPDMDVLWASPDCRYHSEAAQPGRAKSEDLDRHHQVMRMTACAVIEAAEAKSPRVVVVENVRKFARWRLYQWWLNGFRELGYAVEEHILTASRWGDPQNRRRIIVVASKGKPLRIEEPFVMEVHLPAIGPHLDFDAGEWMRIKDIPTAGARERLEYCHKVYGGRRAHGVHVSTRSHWARSVLEPAPTITTKDQNYVTADGLYRRWLVEEASAAQGFPRDYFSEVPTRGLALRMIGNAMPIGMGQGILEQVAARL